MIFTYKESVALLIFVLVFSLIIERRRFNNIPIWTSMLIGAAFMVGFQVVSIQDAFKSINLDVIIFLFGMFSIVSALDKAGVLKLVALKMLYKAKARGGADSILFVIIVGLGILSAFLVNDTIALLGVPIIVHISRNIQIKPTILFLALAFGISIGNPQNLLVAIKSGIPLPFLTFMKWLFIPTMANLFIIYLILKIYFREELSKVQSYGHRSVIDNNANSNGSIMSQDATAKEASSSSYMAGIITNPNFAKLSIIILFVTIAGFIISEILEFILHIAYLSISIVSVIGATALYALSSSNKERREILYSIDYSVLVFFAAMFVFTYGLWSSGLIPLLISHIPNPSHGAQA